MRSRILFLPEFLLGGNSVCLCSPTGHGFLRSTHASEECQFLFGFCWFGFCWREILSFFFFPFGSWPFPQEWAYFESESIWFNQTRIKCSTFGPIKKHWNKINFMFKKKLQVFRQHFLWTRFSMKSFKVKKATFFGWEMAVLWIQEHYFAITSGIEVFFFLILEWKNERKAEKL